MDKAELVELVVKQFTKDVHDEDLTVIEEAIKRAPLEAVQSYINNDSDEPSDIATYKMAWELQKGDTDNARTLLNTIDETVLSSCLTE